MKRLRISNIGAIKEVDVELNKLNIFIGPQSNGKSTIIKIASYCSWVEKKTVFLKSHQERLQKEGAFAEELMRFHKLNGYLNEGSYIYYESDSLILEYKHKDKKPSFEWKKDKAKYKKGRISYIPSERNIVASIPNWMDVKLPDNNIRSFMSDWEDARRSWEPDNAFHILNLGITFFSQERKDLLKIDEANKEIDLTNASGGLQSLIPLLVVLHYMYDTIYSRKGTESVQDLKEFKSINFDLMSSILGGTSLAEFLEIINDDKKNGHKMTEENAERLKSILGEYFDLENRFNSLSYTEIYLEEPEQNLFPTTQKELLCKMIEMLNMKEEHSLTFSTHSPYMLTSLNNLLYAYVAGQKNENDTEKIIKKSQWFPFDRLKAYYVEGGTVKSITDEETNQIAAETIDDISIGLNEEFYQLIDIE